jgi:hypothetical protein
MNVYTEYFRTKDALFKRANAILKKNGVYDITGHPLGFAIDYFFSEGCRIDYTVLKGRDGQAFKLTLEGKGKSKRELALKKGDVLFLYYQRKKKAWFYCPKAIIGKRKYKMESSIGFTTYGTVKNMMDEGLIEKVVVK